MKKALTALCLSIIFLLPLGAQTQVSKAEFEAHQKTVDSFQKAMQDSIQQIGKRVDNGAETLAISKEYAEKADKTFNNFFNIIIWGTGILAFFGVLSLWAIYKLSISRYKRMLDERLAESQKEFRRMLKTENETIFLKENADILILLHKGSQDKDDPAFKTLEKSIVNNYKNTKHASLASLKDFQVDVFSKNRITASHQPKVIVLDDALFAEFKNEGKIPEGQPDLIAFFQKLEDNKIGLCLFGRTELRGFNLSYIAFANQAYSVYANLNNLLKYMRVAENIEIK